MRSIDRLGEEPDDRSSNYKKTAGEQGIYGKPRTEQNLSMQQHHYNQHVIQQHLLAQQASQSRQAIQQYQLTQQFKSQQQNFYPNRQISQARSQEMLTPAAPDQMYYQSSYGSAPQRPVQRYGMSQGSDQNYVIMHHSQMNEREIVNERYVDDRRPAAEKRSAQQLERDNLRQKSFEARRAASQPQLACDDELRNDIVDNNAQPQMGQNAVRRGSHGNLVEATRTSHDNDEKDSDDGGFLKRNNSKDRHLKDTNDSCGVKSSENNISEETNLQKDESSYNDSKVPEALMGSPRKRLEGEIGKIEGVYNIGQKNARIKTDKDGTKKGAAESGASSDYDKAGQSSSNADSGRGSAAYSSGRRPGGIGVHANNESPDLHRPASNFKDLYHSGN